MVVLLTTVLAGVSSRKENTVTRGQSHEYVITGSMFSLPFFMYARDHTYTQLCSKHTHTHEHCKLKKKRLRNIFTGLCKGSKFSLAGMKEIAFTRYKRYFRVWIKPQRQFKIISKVGFLGICWKIITFFHISTPVKKHSLSQYMCCKANLYQHMFCYFMSCCLSI